MVIGEWWLGVGRGREFYLGSVYGSVIVRRGVLVLAWCGMLELPDGGLDIYLHEEVHGAGFVFPSKGDATINCARPVNVIRVVLFECIQ